MRLYSLLLLLLGSSHGVFTQLPELMEEEGVTPEPVDDTYWSGTAPICMGGCKGRHQELKKDRCGDSDCCWFGYKSLCRVNCGRPDVDYNGMVYGNDWWVGSVVRYACRSGFLLVGDPARACQSNGGWTPKPSCLRVCRQGRVEITEKELETATCSSTCPLKSYMGPLKQGCYGMDNCRKMNPDWKRWFTRCDTCLCDCHIACVSSWAPIVLPLPPQSWSRPDQPILHWTAHSHTDSLIGTATLTGPTRCNKNPR
eukprot:XP_014051306.1 PREDICTED: uncharacterized protein LOC106602873 isoform X2 [Salmo salar]